MAEALSDEQLKLAYDEGDSALELLTDEELSRLDALTSKPSISSVASGRKAQLESQPPIEVPAIFSSQEGAYARSLAKAAKAIPHLGERILSGYAVEDAYGSLLQSKPEPDPMAAKPPQSGGSVGVLKTIEDTATAPFRLLNRISAAMVPGTRENAIASGLIVDLVKGQSQDIVDLLSDPGAQLEEHPGKALLSALDIAGGLAPKATARILRTAVLGGSGFPPPSLNPRIPIEVPTPEAPIAAPRTIIQQAIPAAERQIAQAVNALETSPPVARTLPSHLERAADDLDQMARLTIGTDANLSGRFQRLAEFTREQADGVAQRVGPAIDADIPDWAKQRIGPSLVPEPFPLPVRISEEERLLRARAMTEGEAAQAAGTFPDYRKFKGEYGSTQVQIPARIAAAGLGGAIGGFAGSKLENEMGVPMTLAGAVGGVIGGHAFMEALTSPRYREALKATFSIGGRKPDFEEHAIALLDRLLVDKDLTIAGQPFNPRRAFLRVFTVDANLPPEIAAQRRILRTRLFARQQEILDLSKALDRLSKTDQNLVDSFARGDLPAESLRQKPKVLKLAQELRAAQDRLSQDLIECGLVTGELKATLQSNMGSYLPRLYLHYERTDPLQKVANFLSSRGEPLSRLSKMEGLMKREDLPADVRKALEELSSEFEGAAPGYVLAKRGVVTAADVEYAKYANFIASSEHTLPMAYVTDPATHSVVFREGPGGIKHADFGGVSFRQMGDNKRLGALRNRFVQEDIAYDLETMHAVAGPLGRILDAGTGFFKRAKVVWSPPAWVRNVISGGMQADVGGGLSPARMDIYGKALFDLKDRSPLYLEARSAGALGGTFVGSELNLLRDSLKGSTNAMSILDGAKKTVTWAPKKMEALNQATEQFFKMALYRYSRNTLGMSPEDAAAQALKHGFDYREVPQGVRWIRRSPVGAPFITYSYKSIPQAMGAALSLGTIPEAAKLAAQGKILSAANVPFFRFWKYPLAFAALNEYSANKFGIKDPRDGGVFSTVRKLTIGQAPYSQFLPGYVGSMQALLPHKDQWGRLGYYDMTWTAPWGDIGEVGSGPVGKVMARAGLPFPRALEPSNPWLQMGMAAFNYDMTRGEPILKEGATGPAEVSEAMARWATRLWSPNLLPPSGYGYAKLEKAFEGDAASDPNVQTPAEALGAEVGGLRVRWLDPRRSYSFKAMELKAKLKNLETEARRETFRRNPEGALAAEARARKLVELFQKTYGSYEALPQQSEAYKKALERGPQ